MAILLFILGDFFLADDRRRGIANQADISVFRTRDIQFLQFQQADFLGGGRRHHRSQRGGAAPLFLQSGQSHQIAESCRPPGTG